MKTKFLHVQPSELKFPVRLNRVSTCWLQLTNISTDHSIAFKVKTTKPKKYCVRPNMGIISPGSTCVVTVSMQAQKEIRLDIPKHKFLIQSMIAPVGLTSEKITSEMPTNGSPNPTFVTTDPPSPIPEEPVEECRIEVSELEKQIRKKKITLLDSEWNIVLKLIDEKFRLVQENQKLQYDAEMVRRQIKSIRRRNVVILVSVWLLCFVIGYFIKLFVSCDCNN